MSSKEGEDALLPRLVDRQGRVVVPKAVLEALKVEKGRGYVVFKVEGKRAHIVPVEWTERT